MTARILDGRRIAEELNAQIGRQTAELIAARGVRPHLAAVLVGDHAASLVYVRNKRSACQKAGMVSSLEHLPRETSQEQLGAVIDRLNRDPGVHGILVQLPLPGHIDERSILMAIDPFKDVDGLHPANVGLLAQGHARYAPCTPAGVQQILVREGIPTRGAHVVIVGRSNLVGKPLAMILAQKRPDADATVTICHRQTRDLAAHARRADILVAAIGQPEMITGEMIRPGAAVIDVGISRTATGKLVGDVHFASASAVAGAITPVPGGVGPMTVAMLLVNTLKAARLTAGGESADGGSARPGGP